jgi:hypothetical protein
LLTENPFACRGTHLVEAQDAQKRTIQKRAGEKGPDGRRSFAIGIRECVVHRRESHLRAEADEDEQESSPQPAIIEPRGSIHQVDHGEADGRISLDLACRGNRQQKHSHQGERNADRANQQVFPGRFERPVVAMEINQRRAGQSGRLDRHP